MKRKPLYLIALTTAIASGLSAQTSVYDFTVSDAKGNDLPLAQFKGKVLLIVNTATHCGFTPQYKELQAIHDRWADKGLVILDFPCNQFGEQAPGSMEEITKFCSTKYHTAFAQLQKVEVNGPNAHPLWPFLYGKKGFAGFGKGVMATAMDKMLKSKDKDYAGKPDIKWNFTKFLVNRQGEVVARFEPTADMKTVGEAIETAIAEE
ncbi:MAG: glutathione peroxidase [Bacteroidales bacterium]|nr:glutathione peroxidase [Bacteroidales bacterium]